MCSSDLSDRLSIMCYQIPGNLTKDGKPILGGTDIDQLDYDFMAQVYPKAVAGQADAKVASAAGLSGHHGHGCAIDVTLHGGNRLSVPADASLDQIRRLVAALR